MRRSEFSLLLFAVHVTLSLAESIFYLMRDEWKSREVARAYFRYRFCDGTSWGSFCSREVFRTDLPFLDALEPSEYVLTARNPLVSHGTRKESLVRCEAPQLSTDQAKEGHANWSCPREDSITELQGRINFNRISYNLIDKGFLDSRVRRHAAENWFRKLILRKYNYFEY